MKIKAWLRKNEISVLIGVALLVGLALSIEGVLCASRWGGLLLNLGTEIIGAVATYFLFAWFIGRREKKADLIAKMRSQVPDMAIAAVEELRRHGWLTDGSLRGADLGRAKLQGANLRRANLQWAFLYRVNLQGTEFNEDTTLPDGTNWTPDTDMARFTDRNHPDFWSPLLWLPEE